MEDSITPEKNKTSGQIVKDWLKNPYNLQCAVIILGAFVVHLYYFSLTKSQSLWWDEADYLAYAKTIAGIGGGWIVTPGHLSLFSFIVAAFFKLGVPEIIIKFFVAFLPTFIVVPIVYFFCRELYHDKRIALISSLLMAVFWEFLFYGQRFHLESPGLALGFLALYVFVKGYQKQEKLFGKIPAQWALLITAALVALTIAIRLGYFLFGVFIALYALVALDLKALLRNKHAWIIIILGITGISLVSLYRFEAISSYLSLHFGGTAPLKVFKIYFEDMFHTSQSQYLASIQSPLFYLFWIGILVIAFNIFFYWGHIRKTQGSEIKGDVLALIMIVSTLAYFAFLQNTGDGFGDQRWYYPLLLGSFISIARATTVIADFLKKYHNLLGIAVIIAFIGYGGYYELMHADYIIKNKIPSYTGIKEAGLLIKSSVDKGDVVAVPLPQAFYYSERKVIHPNNISPKKENATFDDFLEEVRENEDIKYIIITFSEPGHPSWMRREKEEYMRNPQTGQSILAKWEIPFMNTTIDFLTNKQDIKQSVIHGNITFRLLEIKQEVFVYKIERALINQGQS